MRECNRCRGGRFVEIKMRDMSGKQTPHGTVPVLATILCPQCDGKGHIDGSESKNRFCLNA
jgi:Ribonuclease G/E